MLAKLVDEEEQYGRAHPKTLNLIVQNQIGIAR